MHNQKLFWVVFFILSCCEFGQFAYSENTTEIAHTVKTSSTNVHSDEEKPLDSDLVFSGKSVSYSLPR